MKGNVSRGVAGGLVAGVIFGLIMQVMTAPTPEGGEVSMMAMVAQVVRSEDMAVGWFYHLFNSAVIGGIFGWFAGNRVQTYAPAFGWGALYGIAWWILGGLVLMPMILGMNAFEPLAMESMRPVAVGSFMGHFIFGVTLGGCYIAFAKKGVRRVSFKERGHA